MALYISFTGLATNCGPIMQDLRISFIVETMSNRKRVRALHTRPDTWQNIRTGLNSPKKPSRIAWAFFEQSRRPDLKYFKDYQTNEKEIGTFEYF